jgi:dynein heavy chain
VKHVRATDRRIEKALRQTVKRSLQELSKAINGDAKNEPHPLFKVNMVLDESKAKVQFMPSMSDLSTMVKQMSKQSITTIQVGYVCTCTVQRRSLTSTSSHYSLTFATKYSLVIPFITTIQVVPRLTETLPSASYTDVDAVAAAGVQFASHHAASDGKHLDEAAAAVAKVTKAAKASSFYDVISNDDDILKILVNIMHGTANVAVDLGRIISHYDRYQPSM